MTGMATVRTAWLSVRMVRLRAGRLRTATLTTAVCLAALAFPASATAIKCAPPGNSGVDQYFETIPGGSCNAGPPGSAPGSASGKPGAHNLSPAEARGLASHGAAGRAVATLVSSTAPPLPGGGSVAAGRHTGAHSGGRSRRALVIAPPTGHGANPIAGALRPIVTGSGTGSGPLLPIFLAAAALALALVTILARWRAHRRSP
jgi:hypothetical protein